MIFIFLGDGASSSEQIPSGIAGMLQKALQQRSGALGWSSRWDLFIFNNFGFHEKNHEKINIFPLYFSVRKKMMPKMTRTNGMIRKCLANVTQYREKYLTQPLPKNTEISRNNELLSFQNIDFKTIYIEAKYLLT